MKRCARRSFDEAVSSVPVNRQDHQAPTVGPCKTCSHPQREFLEVFVVFCVVVCWCNHRSLFVRDLFGDFAFSTVRLGFCSVKFEFFGSFGYPWEKRWFLVELQVSLEVRGVLEFLAEFSAVFFRLIAESIVAEVSVVRCIL